MSALLSLDLSVDIIYSSSNVTQSCVNTAILGSFSGYYIFLQQCHPIMCQHWYPWIFQWILYIPPAMSPNHVSTLICLGVLVDSLYSSSGVTRPACRHQWQIQELTDGGGTSDFLQEFIHTTADTASLLHVPKVSVWSAPLRIHR